MSPNPDSELMALVQTGDHQAFAQLVDRYKDAMVGYVLRLTGSRERAEELAQETFLKLFVSAPSYTENGHLRAYLFRIATNLVRSDARKERRWRSFADQSALPTTGEGHGAPGSPVRMNGSVPDFHAKPAPSPDVGVLNAEMHRELSNALAELPLRFRVPVVLHDVEDWTYDEIARVTGNKTGTIKSRINRGRKRLRETLAPRVGEVPS